MKALLRRWFGSDGSSRRKFRGKDRRQHPRIPTKGYDALVEGTSAGSTRVRVKDVSRGGLCFEAREPFQIGRVIPLRLRVPYSQRYFDATAEVVRTRPSETPQHFLVAARFKKVASGEDQAMFETFLSWMTRPQPKKKA